MRRWREVSFAHSPDWRRRTLLRAWARLALHPSAYHFAARLVARTLGVLGRRRGAFSRLPLAGRWTRERDFPAPQGATFQELWRRRRRGVSA
jgi:L-lactate dehydrogenase complex protein LldF